MASNFTASPRSESFPDLPPPPGRTYERQLSISSRHHSDSRSITTTNFSTRPPSASSSLWPGQVASPLSPASSTSSLASIKSYRSTSSDSPLFMFKKQGRKVALPFEGHMDRNEFHQISTLAKAHQEWNEPGSRGRMLFKLFYTLLILSFVYFVLIGYPLWDGLVHWFWNFMHLENNHSIWGMLAFIIWGSILSWLPQLLSTYEKNVDDPEKRDASECCLIIPCYKSAEILKTTLPAALAIYKPEQIFVVANGNSPTPLDNTEEVCKQFGVEHTWVPVGSKIVAEFVGVSIAKKYKYCMMIDDDCILPSNMPLPTDRFVGNVACIGYTIKSTGEGGSRGTWIQQAQDMEYKVAGLTKVFQSRYGSTTFPHGAVALWKREVLDEVFQGHPGYHISEDWYLGHTARSLGYRVIMCSQIFVETETPPALFKGGGGRGGYGEMTVFKQRFYRWNFFYVMRIYSDMCYLLLAWRLGWREIITKLFILMELYSSVVMMASPLLTPVMFATAWRETLMATGILLGLNFTAIVFFNAVHLRRKGQMVQWGILPVYFGMKFILFPCNCLSIYFNLYRYADFFSKRHLRVTENVVAWGVIKNKLAEAEYGQVPRWV